MKPIHNRVSGVTYCLHPFTPSPELRSLGVGPGAESRIECVDNTGIEDPGILAALFADRMLS